MQEKFSIVAIFAVITAVFTTTLAMSLTVQSAQAVCSARSGACANLDPVVGTLATTKKVHFAEHLNPSPNQAGSGTKGASTAFGKCAGLPGVIKNGHLMCAG